MAQLVISRSSSKCGNCGRSANPSETGHYTQLGYGPDNGKPGCGEEWTSWTTDYIVPGVTDEENEQHVLNWYPNLTEIPYQSMLV